MVTLTVSESQIVKWVRHLAPTAKQTVLRALIPTLDDMRHWSRMAASERGLSLPGADWIGTDWTSANAHN